MPESFGRYELRELLGRGGMGEVYRAFDTVRDREVALKLLPPHLASDESFQSRFRRESKLAARLNDPHIIPIHDFGEIDGRLFLDMRLVLGEDLSAMVKRRGRLPAETAVGIVAQVASALDAAHDSGLVHRDVKPSNVLLSGDTDANPFAYLVDFGIARSDAQEGTQLTSTATTLGTVAYLAPERIAGNPGDRRVDVYALACVLFECLSGHKPFDGEMFAIMFNHVNTPPPNLRSAVPGLPAGLDAVVRRGMAKDPEQRYATAGALARDAQAALRAAAVPLPPQPSPPRRAASDDRATQRGSALPPPVRRPATPPPVRRPTAPVPVHPTGPTPGHAGAARRRGMIAALVALLVVAGGIGAVVALNSGGTSPSADPTRTSTTGSPSPDFPSTGGKGSPAALHVGTGASPAWSDFSSFAGILGTSDGDTEHAYKRANCTLRKAGEDASVGIVSDVRCTVPSTSATFEVARFTSAAATAKYLGVLLDKSGYSAVPWGQAGSPRDARGVRYSAPTDASAPDVTSTVCAMPTYLVQFASTDGSVLPLAKVTSDYWNDAAFPDVVPPTCATDYRTATSSKTEPGAVPRKVAVDFTEESLPAFQRRGVSGVASTSTQVGAGLESIVYDQSGRVSFWTVRTGSGVVKAGESTYPVDADLGPPDVTVPAAQVLTGMSHATFVLRGTFTTDGAGNAIAYTSGSKGWGAIKATSDGNLEPSGAGIGDNRIGLGQDFGYSQGRLETVDCSMDRPISDCSGNNRVFKYWKWAGSEFVLVARAGLRR